MAPEGYHTEAVKTIDTKKLLIPSELPRQNEGKYAQALISGLDSGSLGEGGKAFQVQGQTNMTGKEIADCARMLGIDVIFDTDLLYIAEELLTSPLPEGWERYSAAGGKLYYYNTKTRVTQWSHPLEDYYRSLVFMRKEGDEMLEKKALDNPPTPDEVREMAKYLGIDYREEFGLLEIAKAAVNAPLPEEWENYEDEDAEMYYFNKVSKQTSENHPLDGFFIEVVRQRRAELAEGHEVPIEPGIAEFWTVTDENTPFPWMEFVDRNTGGLYYYNFRQDAICHYHPCHLIRHQIRTAAATRIQALWRGFFIRFTHQQLVMTLAATDLQRIWKGYITRKKINEERNRETVKAATLVQALWRGRTIRIGNTRKKENASAVRIQAKWRAATQRQKTRRLAEKPVLPVIVKSELHKKPMLPTLGIENALSRVQKLSAITSVAKVPREPPLESVDEDGDPIVFSWMREPKPPPDWMQYGIDPEATEDMASAADAGKKKKKKKKGGKKKKDGDKSPKKERPKRKK